MSDAEESFNENCRDLLQQLYNEKELSFNKTSEILAKLRVVTREKSLSPEVIDKKCIELLVSNSAKCQIEAQKCLSNLILNYGYLRENLVDPYVDCVDDRLNHILTSGDVSLKDKAEDGVCRSQISEVLYYDLRIIFLLSALCPGSRAKIRDRLAEKILQVTGKQSEVLDEANYLLVIESLKTLFNLTLDKSVNIKSVVGVIKKLFAIVGAKEVSLLAKTIDESKTNVGDELLVNLIHLLTNMPEQVYLELSDADADKILDHLKEKLKQYKPTTFRDTVLPVLNVCANICKYNENIRKTWFDDIMGSATEFERRPEEYDNLRGRLVKLMTSLDVHIKDIAAEFLHALCGDDTEKFITYTGFGNSAAFLSSRGLLTQGLAGSARTSECNTSTSDKDYHQLRNRLDPITGKLETPKKNPMEGMSEEEKEWHANELAGAITKLANLGVVKPMSIDKQGHLTELKPSDIKEKSEAKYDNDGTK